MSGRRRARATIDEARQAGLDALRACEDNGAFLNLTLPSLLRERGLTGRDAAFATELAYGTARLGGTYDLVLERVVDGGSAALEPAVRVAIRMGAHQLLSMRVPPHAAVATTVELVRQVAGERPVRLANAVLRRIAFKTRDDWYAEIAPPADVDPVGNLAVTRAHPAWIVKAFLDVTGDADRVARILDADNVAPAVTLAVRPGLADASDLIGPGATAGRWSPYAVVLQGGDPASLRQVRDGRAGVQDEGSQLAAIVAAASRIERPDRRWLDMCAGPGGKTALITGLALQRGAAVFSTDIHPHRAQLVASALRGFGPHQPVVTADATRPPWRHGAFDRVLLDAPCTGIGALRRRPELRWRRSPGDVASLVGTQRLLLDAAIDAVRQGGVVVYVTCSPHRDETRGVIDAVVRDQAGRDDAGDEPKRRVVEEDARQLLPGVPDLGTGPSIQLWPDTHGTDAMFIAVLRRI